MGCKKSIKPSQELAFSVGDINQLRNNRFFSVINKNAPSFHQVYAGFDQGC